MESITGPDEIFSRWRLWAPAIGVMATLVVSSHFSGAPAGPEIVGFDKLAHFFVFGLLGTLLFRCLRIRFLDHRRWIRALAGAMLYAGMDELLQYFNPDRSFDVIDWLADFIGVSLALFVYRNWHWYREVLELRLWGGPTR